MQDRERQQKPFPSSLVAAGPGVQLPGAVAIPPWAGLLCYEARLVP